MARPVALRLLCCLLAAGATGHETAKASRKFSDAQVLQGQRRFQHAWKELFNKGDASSCGGAYLTDASLMVRWGPAAQFAHKRLGTEAAVDPTVLHGRAEITKFWADVIAHLGFQDLHAYDESGPYASTGMAVDDDTVTVSGQFSFADGAKGRILSEEWVREGEFWKLRTSVLAIESADIEILERLRPEGDLMTDVLAAMPEAAVEAVQDSSVETESTQAASAEAKGVNHSLVWIILPIGCGFVTFFGYRQMRRGQSIRRIAGPDGLLG